MQNTLPPTPPVKAQTTPAGYRLPENNTLTNGRVSAYL